MIVIDTSVWIAWLRRPTEESVAALGGLLDADEVALPLPVRVELLAGSSPTNRKALRQALSALPVAHPSEETWRILERWVAPAADAGHRFTIGDLLIAALASELGALVWSFDRHFEQMEKLRMVRLY